VSIEDAKGLNVVRSESYVASSLSKIECCMNALNSLVNLSFVQETERFSSLMIEANSVTTDSPITRYPAAVHNSPGLSSCRTLKPCINHEPIKRQESAPRIPATSTCNEQLAFD
jgi:hypothetical protein